MLDERLYNALAQFTNGFPEEDRRKALLIAEEVERQIASRGFRGSKSSQNRPDTRGHHSDFQVQTGDNHGVLE